MVSFLYNFQPLNGRYPYVPTGMNLYKKGFLCQRVLLPHFPSQVSILKYKIRFLISLFLDSFDKITTFISANKIVFSSFKLFACFEQLTTQVSRHLLKRNCSIVVRRLLYRWLCNVIERENFVIVIFSS